MSVEFYLGKLKFALQMIAVVLALGAVQYLASIPDTKVVRFLLGVTAAAIVIAWNVYWWWQQEKREMRERALQAERGTHPHVSIPAD